MADGLKVKFNKSDLDALVKKARAAFDSGDLLNAIGLRELRWIDQNFRAGGDEKKWAPLRPNTKAARRGGGAQILRDTGRLAQSFFQQVSGNAVLVGTKSQIAPYHHFGTGPYTIRPKRAGMLRFKTTDGYVMAREVNHPGLPERPLLPTEKKASELAKSMIDAAVKRLT